MSLTFGLTYHYSQKFRFLVSKLFSKRVILFFFGNPFTRSSRKAGEVFTSGGFATFLGFFGMGVNNYVANRSRICRDRALSHQLQCNTIFPSDKSTFQRELDDNILKERAMDPLLNTLDTFADK